MTLLTALLLTVSAGSAAPPIPTPVEEKIRWLRQCERAISANRDDRKALAGLLPKDGIEAARNRDALAAREHFLASHDAWRELLRLRYGTRRVMELLPEAPVASAHAGSGGYDEAALNARIVGSERLSNNCILDIPAFDAAFKAP
ncbi:MAG: hypothetical protein ACKOXG_01710 [Arenimonas sp.]